jgi:hypothetical protein
LIVLIISLLKIKVKNNFAGILPGAARTTADKQFYLGVFCIERGV